jgi:transcription elongation factor Elf1
MNYTFLNDAYQIQHTNKQTYSQPIKYSKQCIFCGNNDSIALMQNQDNGSFRRCANVSCKKEFRSNILSNAVNNYLKATSHLQGTN